MNRIFDIIRTIFISLEFVFIATFALLVFVKPDIFMSLASRVNTTADLIKFLAVVPPSITFILISQKDDLLFPEQHPAYELLQSWPNYQMLLDRYSISVMWGILSSLASLGVWIFSGDLTKYLTFSLFFCSIITSVITALTFFSATINLKRILSVIAEKPENRG